jgi:hypothetical protein
MPPYLRVRRGRSPLERKAIDAHVVRLGLRVCRETRTVLDPGRARGGFEGLVRTATEAGNARVLGLDALANTRCRRTLASSLGFSRGDREAKADLARASACLVRASAGIRSMCERFMLTKMAEARQLRAVNRAICASVEALRIALMPATLGHATGGDLESISRAYAEYLETVDRYRDVFGDLIDERSLECMSVLASYEDLFIRREASHLTALRKPPLRWISDSSRSVPST